MADMKPRKPLSDELLAQIRTSAGHLPADVEVLESGEIIRLADISDLIDEITRLRSLLNRASALRLT